MWKQYYFIIISIIIIINGLNFPEPVFAEYNIPKDPSYNSEEFEKHKTLIEYYEKNPVALPNYVPKKPGHYTKDDWAAVIDATWGSGLPTEEKMQIFYSFWHTIDSGFACFQNLDLDWDSVWVTCSTEISQGVSRGRFAGMLSHASMALQDHHTFVYEFAVQFSAVDFGVPVLRCASWINHCGVGLTPMPDSSLLVYAAAEAHPLGLEAGDIVLGYNGRPWVDLLRELFEAQLPVTYEWGSSESAFNHLWLSSAGDNYHLFDTIDVVKYSTGDTIHLPTSLMVPGEVPSIPAYEQLEVPGVPFQEPRNVFWGIVEGTDIGYIYVKKWYDNADTLFYNAVDSLMHVYETIGLIIDSRYNTGGNMGLAYPSLELLFCDTIQTIGFDSRCDSLDHDAMCLIAEPELYSIKADPNSCYSRPIALLSGPKAMSAGDQIVLALTFHPNTRVFGRPSRGSFNAPMYSDLYPGFSFLYAFADAWLVDNPGYYITRDDIPVDDDTWFTPDGVAAGIDGVAQAAINWILTGDSDYDGILNDSDNCLLIYNPDQLDNDEDSLGNACDNCPDEYNPDQYDNDYDELGNACDNCPIDNNPDQSDYDSDALGDSCDNCYEIYNPNQEDSDFDLHGDTCDNCPLTFNYYQIDTDSDNVGDSCDNCVNISNPDQVDSDNDDVGDSCDICPGFNDNLDTDEDGYPDSCDNCPEIYNPDQTLDADSDEVGDACDNCPDDDNEDQADEDNDGFGNACDSVCCDPVDGPGDTDNNNVVNILDITYLISYLYKEGSPPPCLYQSDANGNGNINILDITYLIAYLYKGGPVPVCL